MVIFLCWVNKKKVIHIQRNISQSRVDLCGDISTRFSSIFDLNGLCLKISKVSSKIDFEEAIFLWICSIFHLLKRILKRLTLISIGLHWNHINGTKQSLTQFYWMKSCQCMCWCEENSYKIDEMIHMVETSTV